jgi:hypothetical protein
MASTTRLNSLFLMTGILFFSLISLLALIKIVKNAKKAWRDSATEEGFAASGTAVDKKESFDPDQFSYELLKNVMGKIRNVTRHVLNKEHFAERLSMVHMTPTELARKYIAETSLAAKNKSNQ